MGYKVDYGALRSLAGTYNGAVSQWKSGLSSAIGQASAIVTSNNISGNSADRLKEYLDTAYSCLDTSLSMLLSLFQENFLLYIDAYSQQVDSAGDVHIEEQELSDLHSRLETQRGRAQQIAITAENAIQGVLDLVSLPAPALDATDTSFGRILSSLNDLNDAVNGLESAHSSADFANIDALVSSLDAHLTELIGQSKEFKTSFSLAGYASLMSVPALLQATNDAYDQIIAHEPTVAAAAERLENQFAIERAEMEKREKQAKAFKILTYAAAAIGTAVVIAACPAASPVVIGMASGLVTSTLSASADEYVKHGFDMDQWDTGRIGAHACIGTLTGMIGGTVGSEAGLFVKAGVKGLSGALEGAATTSYDQLATYGRITDTKAVLVDAAVKGGSSFAGSLIGGAIAENTKSIGIHSLDMARDDPLNKMHGVSMFLYEGGKSMSTGVVSRGVSNLTGQVISLSTDETPGNLGEIDFASVSEDMFSPESMGKDFVVSGAAGAAKDHVQLRTTDPKTGLTPIVQYKLGNTVDPETGTAPIVDESLKRLELKEQWEKTHLTDWHSTDWENTMNTPEEILQLEEMERNGEFDIKPSEMEPANYSSKAAPLTDKPIELTFTYDSDKYDVEEFLYQGDMQEAGLNDLSVADYLDNYERYQAEGRDQNDAQANYRLGTIETIAYENGEQQIAKLMKNDPSLSYEEASKMIDYDRLRMEATKEVSDQAALHNPDQIAGGDPQNVYAMGSGKVNSSFGSQWKGSRAESLYHEVVKASQGMTRKEMEQTRLNVRFKYESK